LELGFEFVIGTQAVTSAMRVYNYTPIFPGKRSQDIFIDAIPHNFTRKSFNFVSVVHDHYTFTLHDDMRQRKKTIWRGGYDQRRSRVKVEYGPGRTDQDAALTPPPPPLAGKRKKGKENRLLACLRRTILIPSTVNQTSVDSLEIYLFSVYN
jgi:hypothetical protein